MRQSKWIRAGLCAALAVGLGCAPDSATEAAVTLTFSGSSLGAEGQLLLRQLARFESANPGLRVEVRRTPDDASQRHQLFVQWLNARMGEPDVLQLDVVWTAEFAAAGWIRPLSAAAADLDAFVPAAVDASRWNGRSFARPWFVDVGLLYRRTDLVPNEPSTFAELIRAAESGMAEGTRYGLVLQAARYEGLLTGFLELLTAHGGEILDENGDVAIDRTPAVAALTALRDLVRRGVVPREALTWHEEETRFAFQNGEAVFMRNWPYAAALLADSAESRVAGRFAVGPLPAASEEGSAASTLGGALLAVNAYSRHPQEAERLIAFLTAPEQMRERATALGQWPAREALFADSAVRQALGVDAEAARRAIASAVARPVTPVYTQLSEIVQIAVHRTIAGQAEPGEALVGAARDVKELLSLSGLEEMRKEK
jgi:multiple sugar transport system substrate-binding protein